MKKNEISISVIIPIALNEKKGKKLEQFLDSIANTANNSIEVLWMESKVLTSRAKLMNEGTKKAKGEYFWFLHADSHLKFKAYKRLIKTLLEYPKDLVYFDLAFNSDSFLMKINALGANLRSKLFSLPFGDQGFCIHRDSFNDINGFLTNVSYGEDHLFVWKAKFLGYKIISTKTIITTSARKYKKNGWIKTSLTHQYLFIKQVIFALLNQDKL